MTNNEQKKSYSLSDLGPLKRVGAEWLGVCPECGKKHLSVNIEKGLFNCFYAGCNCHGRLADAALKDWGEKKRVFRKQNLKNSDKQMPAHAEHLVKQKDGGEMAPMIPSDYKEVPQKVMDKITIITCDMASKHPSELKPEVSAALHYLESRHISIETAEALKIGAAMHHVSHKEQGSQQTSFTNEEQCICFISYINDKPCNVKYRSIAQKGFSQDTAGNTPQPPYNIDCINPLFLEDGETVDKVIIVEGEQDIMTLRECGYQYVITLGSANVIPAIALEAFVPWLEDVHDIILCCDTDRPGRTQRLQMEKYFGVRSRVVNIPSDCKDISEVMDKYDKETVCDIIDNAQAAANDDIHHVTDYAKEIMALVKGDCDLGYTIGYGPHTDKVFKLNNDGGIILVTGKPGDGKTDVIDDICCRQMMRYGRNVAFLSFEVPAKEKHIYRMLKRILGRTNLSMFSYDDILPYIVFLNEHMVHLTSHKTKATPSNIIHMVEKTRQSQPVDYLVVDPYLFIDNEVGRNTTETEAIKKMLIEFQSWGRREGIWVWIVAHPRKLQKVDGSNENENIDYYTIAGSANWANLGDYIVKIGRKYVSDPLTTANPDDTQERSITTLTTLKVRDQEYCHPGTVHLLRQPCGRYDEFASEAAVMSEIHKPGSSPHLDTTLWSIDDSPL